MKVVNICDVSLSLELLGCESVFQMDLVSEGPLMFMELISGIAKGDAEDAVAPASRFRELKAELDIIG